LKISGVDKVERKDKLVVVLGVALVIAGTIAFVWFVPVRAEPIYGDYTHWGPHPGCVLCDENETAYITHWELQGACCTYYEDPYPLKGGHAYYNIFGVEIHREWEWIS
jgi:hypothetical protein